MESLDKTLKSKGIEYKQLSLEQMRSNFIDRARALDSENEDLVKKAMGLKWNAAKKEQILGELKDCKATIESAEQRFLEAA